LTITLDQPGGTGYLWELEGDATRYRVVDQKIEADESEDTFGGSGTQVFVVEPLVEGTTHLVFRLAAPWSSEAAGERRLIVRSRPGDDT
jgi:predicted secreted protein